MSQFIDPFVVFILFLTAAVIGVGYAVDTYGRAPPKEDDEPGHD